ncbi:hypothetical protein [Ramlibacter rhizophilus]|uniref:DUF1440 domain-containing protein n=1 Tax=Ramlibacter rhizophilus TaxID=1781167 RepID=A0A4Z0BRF8_9BURK|nr:hypothetical protein [Ramlibacter rhizophilus]TFZ01044.1 hypothetical protein EZ242_06515 [Ramlibacter rhizophilus]
MASDYDTRTDARSDVPPHPHAAPGGARHVEIIDVRHTTWWGSAAWAGVIAGVVFAVLQMTLTATLLGGSFWGPLQMIAAILMGPDVLPAVADMTLSIMVVGLLIHFGLSIIYGLIIGAIVHAMTLGPALLVGGLFGLIAQYLLNFYVLAPALFPWFVEATHWVSWLNHVIFGLVAAGVYITLRDRRVHRAPEM